MAPPVPMRCATPAVTAPQTSGSRRYRQELRDAPGSVITSSMSSTGSGQLSSAAAVYKLRHKVFGAKKSSAPRCSLIQSQMTRRFALSTPWGTSPFATSTPVIDSVTRNPAPAPIPIPGLMPLSFPQAPTPYMGMAPQGYGQVPTPFHGSVTAELPAVYGSRKFRHPIWAWHRRAHGAEHPTPYMAECITARAGLAAPTPYLGVPPQGFPQVQALGLDMQMTTSPVAGLGGHAVSPVITMLVFAVGAEGSGVSDRR